MPSGADVRKVKPEIIVPSQTPGIKDGFLKWHDTFEGIMPREVSTLKLFISDFNEFAPDSLRAIWQLQQKILKGRGIGHTDVNAEFSPTIVFYRSNFRITMDIDGLVSIHYENGRKDSELLLGELFIDVIERCGGDILADSKKRMKNSGRERDGWKKGLE